MSTRKDVKKTSQVGKKPVSKVSTKSSKDVEKDTKAKAKKQEEEKLVKKAIPRSTVKKPEARKVPMTPPSKRVTKTQYFPSKSIYANALKQKSNEEAKTKPKEELDSRPRTATLKQPTIINQNLVNTDTLKPAITVPKPQVEPEEDEYEEDFETYDSDFEKYSSSESTTSNAPSPSRSSSTISDLTEDLQKPPKPKSLSDEERKLDSGNFDLPDYKHKQILDNIKESIEKENALVSEYQNRNPSSLSDEGFEDSKSLQFINFVGAQKKCEHRKSIEIKRKRGEQLLSMIRLDAVTYTLFEQPPVPYEEFIKAYGNQNAIQASVQTGDDDLDEETQTDYIELIEKWTQFPGKFKNDFDYSNDWNSYHEDYIGCGTAGMKAIDSDLGKIKNESTLHDFINSAGNLILKLQEESKVYEQAQLIESNIQYPIHISNGSIALETSNEMFNNSKVKQVIFNDDSSRLLAIHRKSSFEDKTVVSLWNLNDFSATLVFGTALGLSCACFGQEQDLFFAGCDDGMIVLWDIKSQNLGKTAAITSTEIKSGHLSPITALRLVQDNSQDVLKIGKNKENQLVSLDESGELIVWNIIVKQRTEMMLEQTSLTKSILIDLKALDLFDLHATDLLINKFDQNQALISTNYGFVLQCCLDGTKPNISKFYTGSTNVNCLDSCDFSKKYFISGTDTGNLNLHSKQVIKPLMVLSNKDLHSKESGIELVQWSKMRPFIFYAVDSTNRLQIWDLSYSDMYPKDTQQFQEKISCVRLSPSDLEERRPKYMAIGFEDGKLILNLLKEENKAADYDQEKQLFLNYVNRL